MCAIAFFAFLRIGEITTTSGESTNLIRITQLDRLVDKKGNVKALQLTLINYKHSDPGQNFVVYIYPESLCCPVQLLLQYVSLKGYAPGPLFCWPDWTPITRTFFVTQLKAALKFNNLDCALYKAHSFRIGAGAKRHITSSYQKPRHSLMSLKHQCIGVSYRKKATRNLKRTICH